MSRLSDTLDRLRSFPNLAADLATFEREWTAIDAIAPRATMVRTSRDRLGFRPVMLRPVVPDGGVSDAIALGWHNTLPGIVDDAPALMRDGRLLAGWLVHNAKQYDMTIWTPSQEDIHRIGMLAAWAMATSWQTNPPDLIVAMPSSRGSNGLPHELAVDIGFLTRTRVAPASAVQFTREIEQVKQVRDYWVKRELLAGSMVAEPHAVQGASVLIVDDVCRTGVTLRECVRACCEAGAREVRLLTISKTWAFQRLPNATERHVRGPLDHADEVSEIIHEI